MAGLALSGLVSGFDWKGIVDQLIEVSRAPQNRMRREKTELAARTTALNEVRSAVSTLKSSVTSLGSESALLKKAASIASADSKWKAAASTAAIPGEYNFQLLQTATAGVVRGKTIGQPTPNGDVLLQNVPIGRTITSGNFSINGHVINVDITSDTYNSIANKIEAQTLGTSNPLTAFYDSALDKFTIVSGSGQSILLGTAADTSNFLQAMDLSSASIFGQTRTGGRDLSTVPLSLGSPLSSMGISDGWITVNGTDLYVEPSAGDTLNNFLNQVRNAVPGIVNASLVGGRVFFESTGALQFSLPDPAPNGDPVSDVLHELGILTNDENNQAPTSNYGIPLGFQGTPGAGSGLPAQRTSSTLGKINLNTPLNSADTNLGTSLTGTTTGSFYVNGAEITYNTSQDSIRDILDRINGSSAGVSASYDLANDAIVLTNKTTGQLETFVTTQNLGSGGGGTDDAGLVDALFGLAAGTSPSRAGFSTLSAGRNAIFSINGGGNITSRSNVFDETVHGISGLTVDATAESGFALGAGSVTEKVSVKGDSSAAREAVSTFISNYNSLQAVIEKHTKVVYADGKVNAGILAGSREMADISRTLRQSLFQNVGFTGSVKRLSDLGVTSSGIESVISLSNAALLESKINTDADDVMDYFTNATSGLIPRLNAILGDSSTDVSAASGKIGIQLNSIQKQNTSLDKQIADFERRLDSQRQLLESSFIAMERAQSQFQQQSAYLQRTFAGGNK